MTCDSLSHVLCSLFAHSISTRANSLLLELFALQRRLFDFRPLSIVSNSWRTSPKLFGLLSLFWIFFLELSKTLQWKEIAQAFFRCFLPIFKIWVCILWFVTNCLSQPLAIQCHHRVQHRVLKIFLFVNLVLNRGCSSRFSLFELEMLYPEILE